MALSLRWDLGVAASISFPYLFRLNVGASLGLWRRQWYVYYGWCKSVGRCRSLRNNTNRKVQSIKDKAYNSLFFQQLEPFLLAQWCCGIIALSRTSIVKLKWAHGGRKEVLTPFQKLLHWPFRFGWEGPKLTTWLSQGHQRDCYVSQNILEDVTSARRVCL